MTNIDEEYVKYAVTLLRRWVIDPSDPDLFQLVRYAEFDPHLTIEALASVTAVLLGALAAGEDTTALDQLAAFASIACPPTPVNPLLL